MHFPIALIAVAALAELGSRPFRTGAIRRGAPRALGFALSCLALGAASALVAAVAGWTLAQFEPPGQSDVERLFLHRWLGVGGAALSLAALGLGLLARSARAEALASLYRGCLLLAVAAIGGAGHLGGMLVFGPDWYADPFADAAPPGPPETADSAAAASVPPAPPQDEFGPRVLALFEAHCVECHGPKKKKAGVRLDSLAAAIASDIFAPGDPGGGELVRRIRLPEDDPDRMPPEGEALAPADVDVLRRWVASLGPAGLPAAAPAEAGGAGTAAAAAPAVLSASAEGAIESALAALRARGARAGRIAGDTPAVEVDFSGLGRAATDADLALLRGLEPVLERLVLADTGVSDEGLAALAGFDRLRRVHLQRTEIGDAAVPHLAALPALEWLNLYGTRLGDAGALALAESPRLEQLFLWQSLVSESGAAAAAARKPGLRIDRGSALAAAPSAAAAPEAAGAAPPSATTGPPGPRAPCCDAAAAEGRECDHPCCVEARGRGQACPKCSVP